MAKPEIRQNVAIAMYGKGRALAHLGRDEEALEVYDEVIASYDRESQPELTKHVARALLSKGLALERLDRKQDAAGTYNDLLALEAGSEDAAIEKLAASARARRESLASTN